MTLHDLCKTCENIDVVSTVYIYNNLTLEVSKVCKIIDILHEHGNDTIKWFCIRYDEDVEVSFM